MSCVTTSCDNSIESKRHAALLSAIRPFLRSRSLLAVNFIAFQDVHLANIEDDNELLQWLASFLLSTFPSCTVLDVLFDFMEDSARSLFHGFRLCCCAHLARAIRTPMPPDFSRPTLISLPQPYSHNPIPYPLPPS